MRGAYVHFTEEQKDRANRVDLVDFLQKRSVELERSGKEKKIKSQPGITVYKNRWYDHYRGKGGYPVEFIQRFYNVSYPEAVTMLLDGETGTVTRTVDGKEKKKEAKKPFALPAAHSDMRSVFGYLLKTRLLDREVVSYFVRRKLIYESCEKSKDKKKEYHNAVFVGCDEKGVPRHAHKRGLYTKGTGFKGNVEGCNPNYSFHYAGTSNRLYVFEAPIDMLSYITLHPKDWQKHSYVALCGVSAHALLKMLELHPHLDYVVLCLDHDERGIEASEEYQDLLSAKGIPYENVLSIHKDWNEDIKAQRGLSAIPAQEHPQYVLRDEICREIAESKMDMSSCSADILSAVLAKAKSHLHWGRFSEAEDCLREICQLSMAAAATGYIQIGHNIHLSDILIRTQSSFRAYKNRMHLKSRLDLLEFDIMCLRSFEDVVTASGKESLAKFYEQTAGDSLKGVILLEIHQQKMNQNQNLKMSM